MDAAFNQVLNTQKRVKNGKKETKQPTRKIISEPTDIIDPENEKIKPTLIKVCALLEWLKAEVKDLREEIESKADFSNLNTLSLKVDAMDGVISDLSNDIDDLKD